MKFFKLRPPYLLWSVIAIGLASVISLQVILYFKEPAIPEQAYEPLPQEQLVLPTSTIIVQLTGDSSTTVIEPTATALPSGDEEINLPTVALGYITHGMNCPFITQIVAHVLEEELNTAVAIIPFSTNDELFMALSDSTVDLTLCVIDPNDRPKIKKHLGYIRQIGSYYWSDGDSKLQIWANGAAKAELRERNPCLLGFFEDLNFTDIVFQDDDAKGWVANHVNEEVDAWIRCVPENLEQ